VYAVALNHDGSRALSAGEDSTLRVWNVRRKRCERVLEGHTGSVCSVALSSNGSRALSGAEDSTVRLWNVDTGRCEQVLEGHTGNVISVALIHDGRRVFSAAANGVLRIWDLAGLPSEPPPEDIGIPVLPPAPGDEQYTNAKVLLVGDTGVGKSGMAERLVHGRFVETKSSHARRAHILDSQIVQQGGVAVHRETILWDLAGQPAYRLVHQLSMDDAALACVLFDCRNELDPFEGAAYWSRVLDQARTNTELKKLLIASRIDVGGLPASKQRIEDFARDNGFALFIPTSASTGDGCPELLEAIGTQIPWEGLPTVTTTDALAALRKYVIRLKDPGEDPGKAPDNDTEAEDAGPPVRPGLLSIAALHEGFSAYFGEKVPFDEFVSHLERLEATDALALLVFRTAEEEPGPESMVLLDSTRLDAYASALLVAAKDEPDGPGHLLESRVREGDFKLDDDERMPDRESEAHVLWYVIEYLLSRDLALREQIRGKDYVVFPSQCTAAMKFPGAAAFGVAFEFAGPVRGIYATLIAQLAHYEGFDKREFFKDAAAYRAESGGRCLVRFKDGGRGEAKLEVLFDGDTPTPVRQGFLEFVGRHLQAKSTLGSVSKRHAYHCGNEKCGEQFDDRVVTVSLDRRHRDLLCPYCRKSTPLVDLLKAPTKAAKSVAAEIDTDAKAGRQRMTASLVIRAKEAEGKFDLFLSHNSKDKAAVLKIAEALLKKGIRPWLDVWQLPPGTPVTDALEEAIQTIPCAGLCFGPADIGKWHIMEIRAYLEGWAAKDARMIPIILPGAEKTPELPLFVRQTLWVDMRDWQQGDSDALYRLVCGILDKAPGNSPKKKFGPRDVVEWQEDDL